LVERTPIKEMLKSENRLDLPFRKHILLYMKNTLTAIALSATIMQANACTKLQESVLADLHKIYTQAPEHRTLCRGGNLFYIDQITYPIALVVTPDGSVGVCNKKMECREEAEWKKKYKEAVSKRST